MKDLCPQGSAAGSTTSSSDDQQQDQGHHRRRNSGRSTTSTGKDQGRIFVRKDQQQDQPHRRRRNGGQIIYVDAEDQEDLHRQRSGAEVFYIHRYQMVAFFCYFDFSSLQSRVVPVWGWLSLGVFEYRKFSPGGLQVRVGGRE